MPVVIYARVSTLNQQQKGDLKTKTQSARAQAAFAAGAQALRALSNPFMLTCLTGYLAKHEVVSLEEALKNMRVGSKSRRNIF